MGKARIDKWLESFMSVFKHCVDVAFNSVPENDYEFWVVSFEDGSGNTLFRKDADKDEIARMKADPDGYCKVWREFPTDTLPKKWVVWPHSSSKGWCERIEGSI